MVGATYVIQKKMHIGSVFIAVQVTILYMC